MAEWSKALNQIQVESHRMIQVWIPLGVRIFWVPYSLFTSVRNYSSARTWSEQSFSFFFKKLNLEGYYQDRIKMAKWIWPKFVNMIENIMLLSINNHTFIFVAVVIFILFSIFGYIHPLMFAVVVIFIIFSIFVQTHPLRFVVVTFRSCSNR